MPDIRFDTMQPTEVLVNTMADVKTGLETDIANAGSNLGTGKVFYVDSGAGSDTYTGTTPATATATIDAAIALCTASRGDVIYVMQGHAEAITAATSCVCDIAGISIIGLGNGSLIPTLTFTTADTAVVSVTAANVRISNIKFVANFANVASLVTLGAAADGAVIDHCIFTDSGAALDYLVGITVTADCDNITIVNNRFDSTATATTDNAILLAGGSDDSLIKGNIVYGTFTDGGILASAAASTNIAILDNVVGAIDAIGIGLHASTTGLLGRNLVGANTTSIAAALPEVSGMFCWENYVTGDLAASGIIYPAVDAD